MIPSERIVAMSWVFQTALLSFLCMFITSPYISVVLAHENMQIYAIFSIIESFFKLFIVILLQKLNFDKLIAYGILLFVVSVCFFILYFVFCILHFKECRYYFRFNKALFREIFSYSIWNLFGSTAAVAKNQIINILLNLNFGVVVNAARGIAFQVNNAVSSFLQNFNTALRPQIIKSYASGDHETALRLVFRGCKMSFFLLYVFALPLLLEMKFVLALWLKNPPQNTVLFTRLVILEAIIDSINPPVNTLAQATGKIRLYQGIISAILLFNLPLSYAALALGFPAFSVFVVAIIMTFLSTAIRFFLVKRLVDFSIRQFVLKIVSRCSCTAILAAVFPLLIISYLGESFLRLCVTVCVSVFSVIIFTLTVGFSINERNYILSKCCDILKRGRI